MVQCQYMVPTSVCGTVSVYRANVCSTGNVSNSANVSIWYCVSIWWPTSVYSGPSSTESEYILVQGQLWRLCGGHRIGPFVEEMEYGRHEMEYGRHVSEWLAVLRALYLLLDSDSLPSSTR